MSPPTSPRPRASAPEDTDERATPSLRTASHEGLPHTDVRDGSATPTPSASQTPHTGLASIDARSLRARAESLWHDGRTGRAVEPGAAAGAPPGAAGPTPHADTDTPWQSFFSSFLPLDRTVAEKRVADPSRTSPVAGTAALPNGERDSSGSTSPAHISSWSSTAAPAAPSTARPKPLRLDTQVAGGDADDAPLNSATTLSSYAASSAVSRSSTRRRSSASSGATSPSSKADEPTRVRASAAYTHARAGAPARDASLSRPRLAARGSSPSGLDAVFASSNSQYGLGVRSKLSSVLPLLIEKIPVRGGNATVMIAEFGCLNSRSMQLLRPIIEEFAKHAERGPGAAADATAEAVNVNGIAAVDSVATMPTARDFFVIHEDVPQADFRGFTHLLDTHPESYLNPAWQASHKPSLQNCVFSSFVARPFGSRIVPQDTLHFGFSLMDLQWTHTPNATDVSLATTAQAELTSFLLARASEFAKGGVLVMAFIARSEAEDAAAPAALDRTQLGTPAAAPPPLSPHAPRDIWATMSDMLVPCLQRLVSCGMLKSTVARQLLTLPMHPRTPSQTMRVLNDLDHLWELDWSCGVGQDTPLVSASGREPAVHSEPEPLRLPQPAWVALQSGRISQAMYTEHVIQMFKHLYESHFRMVLRERGKLSKGAAEFILDSLWDVLSSRIEDSHTSPLAECELEVQLIALRRR
ncbi:hypothetical protein MBRA1_003460 [Malassezia brasiliensis]|uniref:Uncharacterized protein n=1 Tax=Malassezia brasiliensis TaxID=1821822 RepID=A0AAF0IPX3_9BASI|nr:hypothetical protein MBRA1_003460 [Malassezia brasiliensis]